MVAFGQLTNIFFNNTYGLTYWLIYNIFYLEI